MLYINLNNGIKMPALGLGTWLATDDELGRTIETALELGYRHFDTAYQYDNEKPLGRVLNKWFTEGKLNRTEVFVTTKLPPQGMYADKVEIYLEKSLENLQLEYVDMYLIHSPKGLKEELWVNAKKEDIKMDENVDHLAVWKVLENQVKKGFIKSLGISNFSMAQIENLYSKAEIKPSTHQIEVHLYQQQFEMVKFCTVKNIAVVAYSPLGSPGINKYYNSQGKNKPVPDILGNQIIKKMSAKYKKTPAQILLRYTLQRGIGAVPKSSNPKRLAENIELFYFNLDETDMITLANEDLALPVVGNWENWTWIY